MRKKVFGRQLKRDKNERKALFKSLLSSLVLYESIQTTEAKAKAIKSSADKLITKAKKGGLHSVRLVSPELSTTQVVKKLLNIIAPRFANRQSGYTRIIRTGKRLKDNAQEVILEWTEKVTPQTEVALVSPPQIKEEPKGIDKKSDKSKVKLDKKTKETKDKKTAKEKTK
jgi:large subunit ribosomal protein L17